MKSLGARLVFYYSMVVAATVGLALGGGFLLIRSQLIAGTDFLLEKEFVEIQSKLGAIPRPFQPEALHRAVYDHALIDSALFFFQIHAAEGTVLFRSPNLGTRTLPDLGREPATLRASVDLPELGLLRVAEFPYEGLHVQVATSLGYLQQLTTKFYTGLAIALPATLLLSVLAGFGLSEVTLRPLRLIQSTAQRINANNLNERIPLPEGKDELARLAQLLNDMFDRLEQSFKQIKQFTADSSHELRTPLSIIRLHAEKVLELPDLPVTAREQMQVLLAEVLRLSGLIDQLLILARAEAQALPLQRTGQSTALFIEQFKEDAEALAEERGRTFLVVRNDELTASFDPGWLRQVLFNLLSNALKFSPPGSTLRLDSRHHHGRWQTTLSDEGPGVPSQCLETIFNRFAQVKSEVENEGLGLGLAVCRSIVELHHGHVFARNLPGRRGFAVSFEIPSQD